MRTAVLVVPVAQSWQTEEDVDDVLSDGGEHPMHELADRARDVARIACGSGPQPAPR